MKNNLFLLFFLFFLSANFCTAQSEVLLPRTVDPSSGLMPGTGDPSSGFLPKPDLTPPSLPSLDNRGRRIKLQNQSNSTSSEFQSEPTESENTFHNEENKSKKTYSQSEPVDFNKELKKFSEEPKSIQAQAAPTKFDWEATNAQRFLNSPCLKTLGFSPTMDPQEQERRFKECEDAKSREEMEKNLKIGLGILLVFGFGGAIVYTYNKGQKK